MVTKHARIAVLALAGLVGAGCSSFAVPGYGLSADNVTDLRELGQRVKIGRFTATPPSRTEISCRARGAVKTADGQPFEAYIERALREELRAAGMLAESAPVTLTGNLDQIAFNSMKGEWSIGLTLTSSNGRSVSVSSTYRYKTGPGNTFTGFGAQAAADERACAETAQAFVPAVRALIGKIVQHAEFAGLVGARSEDVAGGTDLRLLQRVLLEIERGYVEAPDFGLIATGAMQALVDLAPAGFFRVTESERETSVGYRATGGESRTISFSRQTNRKQATGDLVGLFHLARATDPAVSPLDLERAMIVRGLGRLDPDSSLLDAETYREMQVETSPPLGGIGLDLTVRGGSLTVVAPIENAPAHRAGVQSGDRLEQIDGVATNTLTLTEAVRRLRGRLGSTVTITVAREGWPAPRDLQVTREQVRVMPVMGRGLQDGVAYIKVWQFQERTAGDLERALEAFSRTGMKALILDLRDNSGGLLTASIESAEIFLEPNRLITYTEGRFRDQNMRFTAHAKKAYTAVPMVVLVNRGTAAGAEIVAGALQDWSRASLLGTPTFGRASIQTVVPLPDGSGLRLTTTRWFTPKGRLVHGKGLNPDTPLASADAPAVTSATTEEALLAGDAHLRAALEHLTRSTPPKP